jgi:hypothetical protein
VEYPCIAAFVIEGQGITKKINCGGPVYQDYEVDIPAMKTDERPRDLPADDFYTDWALTQFGPEAAASLAKLFLNLDGGPLPADHGKRTANLPRPATWVNGPGGITPDERPWEHVEKEYAFVEEMAELRPRIKGRGNLERFDYWLNLFRYLRAIGQVNCTWAKFNATMKQIKGEKEPTVRIQLAQDIALPIRKELVAGVADVHRYLLAAVTTYGGMGNVTNWQQHIIPTLLDEPGKELAEILGRDLPADAQPSKPYNGIPRLIVPTVRTSLSAGEDMELKVIVLTPNPQKETAIYYRTMGKGDYQKTLLTHVARNVYSVCIPASAIQTDFEYYIRTLFAEGQEITFPATAPNINQTVVIMKDIQW